MSVIGALPQSTMATDNHLGLESNGRAIWRRRVVGASDNVGELAAIDGLIRAIL